MRSAKKGALGACEANVSPIVERVDGTSQAHDCASHWFGDRSRPAGNFVRATAVVRPDVKYLATTGVDNIQATPPSFDDFLGEFKVHPIPHRIWRNYYANSGINEAGIRQRIKAR